MIELTKEIKQPRTRSSRGSLMLGLCLLGAGYWTVGQGIILYHKGVSQFVSYAIKADIAETGLRGKTDERVWYQTAISLDDCRARLDDVRSSIADLPLGGPQK